jgi:hypothetical protein
VTPADVLATYPVLTMTQLATVLNLTHRRGASKGIPDRRLALQLCRDGRIPVIDPSLPWALWTVSATNVRRYIDGDLKATA